MTIAMRQMYLSTLSGDHIIFPFPSDASFLNASSFLAATAATAATATAAAAAAES
jgi:hypothetical protein